MILNDLLNFITTICRAHPQILIFLSIAIGYYIGKLKFFDFSLGSTASVLLAAIALGQIDVKITPLFQSISFSLFIFTIGFKAGPQIFSGLKRDVFKYVVLTVFFALVGLITTILLGKLFNFNQGTTVGLMAGAMTQSAAIGTGEGAVRSLSIATAQKDLLTSDIAVAYAITYIFGVAGLILFYKFVPYLLKLDLKTEAKQLEALLVETAYQETSFSANTQYGNSVKKNNSETDVLTIGLGCFLGTLIGLISIQIGAIPLTLSIGGGILLTGLLFGWINTKYPTFGYMTDAAEWLLTNFCLNLFIACVGLTAAPKAFEAFKAHGLTLFFAGIILTLTPHILGLIFGRLVLKLNYVLLLGALTGAGTATPAFSVLKDETNSLMPLLGFTLPYALANFILTIWGSVIVNLM
jgi:AspT/YidE/YbjL antiporter-like protein